MRKQLITSFLLVCLFMATGSLAQNSEMAERTNRLPQAIVWLEDNVSIQSVISEDSDKKDHFIGNYTVNRCLSKSLNIWLIDLSKNETLQQTQMRILRSDPNIKLAQYNHEITYRKTPNDPLFNEQWEHNNTSQAGGTEDADIDAVEAWDITTGGVTQNGDTIVIAVIDDGMDLQHEDLKENFWKNRGEIPGDGIDNDQNGYTDDFNGWDFYFDNDSIYPGSHGTPIAGIIGAKGNNNIGVAGINWNVKILPVAADVNEASVVEAYSYVLDFRMKYNQTQGKEGGFVVATNSSWGIDYGHPDSFPIWCNMYDTLGKYGILSVAATSNSGEDIDQVNDMPTSCPSKYLISVTSTNASDHLVSDASYGKKSIDIGAPGEEIESTAVNDGYGSFSGTSYAAPMVTGAIGLIYASSCKKLIEDAYLYPDSLARSVKRFIMNGVDSIGDLQEKAVSGGRLNLFNSVLAAEEYSDCQLAYVPPNGTTEQFGILSISPNPATEFINVRYANLKTGNNRFILTDVTGRTIRVWEDGIKGVGEHDKQLNVKNLSAGMYFMRIDAGVRQSPLHKFIIR